MITLLMATLLNSAGIDNDREIAIRFIDYQKAAIYEDSRKALAEKAVRVGYTYAKAFKAVRESLMEPRVSTLFTTKDQPTAFEFIRNCEEHIDTFNHRRSVILKEEKELSIPVYDAEGLDTGVVEKLNVAQIVFDNRSRILAFSSNPNALRAYGGNVMWDEAAFHPKGKQMWAAIQGRARWAYKVDVWSSLSMDDTMFDVLASDARNGKGGWAYHHVDIYEAIDQGLVELINEVRGSGLTREDFLAACKEDCVVPDIFALEYEIKKTNTLAPIVEWEKLKACEGSIQIERAHLPDARVVELFGRAEHVDRGNRRRAVERWLEQNFPLLLEKRGTSGKRFRVGFDVAASRRGDLASYWVDEKTGSGKMRHRAAITFQTEDWDVMQWVGEILFSRLPGEVIGCGDETGLGKQICWNLSKLHHGRFSGVNFSSKKSDIGVALMSQLSANLCELSADHPDLTQDIYSIRKGVKGDRVFFFETKNELIPASHADIGWSKALAAYADVNRDVEVWVLNQDA